MVSCSSGSRQAGFLEGRERAQRRRVLLRRKRASEVVVGGRPPEPPLRPARSPCCARGLSRVDPPDPPGEEPSRSPRLPSAAEAGCCARGLSAPEPTLLPTKSLFARSLRSLEDALDSVLLEEADVGREHVPARAKRGRVRRGRDLRSPTPDPPTPRPPNPPTQPHQLGKGMT
jgi:hypothetical protein